MTAPESLEALLARVAGEHAETCLTFRGGRAVTACVSASCDWFHEGDGDRAAYHAHRAAAQHAALADAGLLGVPVAEVEAVADAWESLARSMLGTLGGMTRKLCADELRALVARSGDRAGGGA